jgi:hypothetical protein
MFILYARVPQGTSTILPPGPSVEKISLKLVQRYKPEMLGTCVDF